MHLPVLESRACVAEKHTHTGERPAADPGVAPQRFLVRGRKVLFQTRRVGGRRGCTTPQPSIVPGQRVCDPIMDRPRDARLHRFLANIVLSAALLALLPVAGFADCPSGSLALNDCRIKVGHKGTLADRDKFKLKCESVDVSALPGGLSLDTNVLTIELGDCSGSCFSESFLAPPDVQESLCTQGPKGWICRKKTGALQKVRFKGSDLSELGLVASVRRADLDCIEASQSPYRVILTVGASCGEVSCPLERTGRTDRGNCPNTCGNGSVDQGEQCDGSGAGSGCPGSCTASCCCSLTTTTTTTLPPPLRCCEFMQDDWACFPVYDTGDDQDLVALCENFSGTLYTDKVQCGGSGRCQSESPDPGFCCYSNPPACGPLLGDPAAGCDPVSTAICTPEGCEVVE